MTVQTFLQQATLQLAEANIETARLDVLVLLEDVLGTDRSHLLAHPERALSAAEEARLNTYITQRCRHNPLAYIRGQVAFYGRIFAVSPAVLVPRPESESIIDLLLHIPSVASKDTTIIDIGTGSGCLGITAALELPNATIELTDISPEALAIARQNAVAHHVRAGIGQADLLDRPFDHPYTVVLANLPYVPTDYPVNQAAWQEPALALFAGNDGMDAYRRLWQQLAALPRKPAHVITESLETQHNYIVQLAQMAGYHLHATQGLAQQFSL